jgi:hypothetical protein
MRATITGLALAAALSGCAGAPRSALVDGLPESSDSYGAFASRVSARYQPGTMASEMTADLRAQGFETSPGRAVRRSALPSVLPGGYLLWTVDWKADGAGRATRISTDVRYESQ